MKQSLGLVVVISLLATGCYDVSEIPVDRLRVASTDDGALIHLSYQGRLNLADQTVVAAPQFLTGDERYTWLNGVQAIAKGKTDGQTLVYDIHEVR